MIMTSYWQIWIWLLINFLYLLGLIFVRNKKPLPSASNAGTAHSSWNKERIFAIHNYAPICVWLVMSFDTSLQQNVSHHDWQRHQEVRHGLISRTYYEQIIVWLAITIQTINGCDQQSLIHSSESYHAHCVVALFTSKHVTIQRIKAALISHNIAVCYMNNKWTVPCRRQLLYQWLHVTRAPSTNMYQL